MEHDSIDSDYFPISGYVDYDKLPLMWVMVEKDVCRTLATAIQLWIWDGPYE